jgi:hypothetical protein
MIMIVLIVALLAVLLAAFLLRLAAATAAALPAAVACDAIGLHLAPRRFCAGCVSAFGRTVCSRRSALRRREAFACGSRGRLTLAQRGGKLARLRAVRLRKMMRVMRVCKRHVVLVDGRKAHGLCMRCVAVRC